MSEGHNARQSQEDAGAERYCITPGSCLETKRFLPLLRAANISVPTLSTRRKSFSRRTNGASVGGPGEIRRQSRQLGAWIEPWGTVVGVTEMCTRWLEADPNMQINIRTAVGHFPLA